ncbi:hypothetical protein F5882DRAFT_236383, partial [Hyaloscypha sp. PMI_1271]
NIIRALYLEYYNFEIRATNTIDRGVFIVSGRALVILTKILENNFYKAFINKYFFFSLFGLLNPDNNNFI